ncbi:MAG: tetratricopeptide repeat protein [bacterium]|nr:tetratricopeptide repeat protein [bacterium]
MNKFYLKYILIGLAVLIAYANILDNEFVFDDTTTIVQNTMITEWKNLKDLFSHKYFSSSGIGDYLYSGEASYRPVVTFTYFLDYALWGKLSFGYHLSNLLYHLISALLFFIVLQRFIPQKQSVLSALLYGIHPVLTEAVNCPSFREDILCAIFFFAVLLFHSKKSAVFNILLFISAICAFFSKEMALSLIPITLIIDVFFYRNTRLITSQNILLLCAFIVYIIVRFFIMSNPFQDATPYPSPSFLWNCATMANIFLSYITLCFFPIRLTLDYVISMPPNHPYISMLLSGSIVFAILSGLAYSVIVRRTSLTLFFAGLFLLALAPVSNLIPLKNIMAERYMYMPFGFFAVFFILNIFNRTHRIFIITFLLILLVCCVRTVSRNAEWTNSYLLWTSTLRSMPNSFHAHNNLAGWYDTHNEYGKAEYHYKKAILIRPYDAVPYFNLGNTYKNQGRLKDAISYYSQAIMRDSNSTEPYVNRGLAYAQLGNTKAAQESFIQAIKLNYSDSSAHNNLGVILSMNGNLEQAINEHVIALKLDPKNDNAYFNLGMCYYDTQNYQKAIAVFEKLFKLNPSHADGNFYAGICNAKLGFKDTAKLHYTIALKHNPNNNKIKEAL